VGPSFVFDHLDVGGPQCAISRVAPGAATQSAKVVNLANWSDDSQSALELHEPEMTDVVIMLEIKH
jgi:hypothetical protein